MTMFRIFGLYALYFVTFVRVMRILIIGRVTERIWLEDMPNPNRIYNLLQDIYIVRAFREYRMEEDLFAKLVFLMRSRELVIKFTREPENTYSPEIIWVKQQRTAK
ncbi:Piezo-type mechanosensitive ion channel component 2-like Protein [Tribolium castaneum]|uniref:Piezo-type mechanosensitive ion channel component 2-like Protein n=1 Tax=Tribolium castaneum TaxID=7070 RepID=D6WLT4_TRICA|nr:Piezo-type mechanosensitive ion channel component 2-like Protein [Tribolium castaneum]